VPPNRTRGHSGDEVIPIKEDVMHIIAGRARLLVSGLIAAVLLTSLAACSTAPPPPGPIDDESSAIGISLKMREGPIHLTSKTPDVVLFVRLEEGESVDDVLSKEVLIPSTLVDGEQAYLLNVSAGTYAAVAALYAVEQKGTPIPVASQNVGSNMSVGVSIDMFGGKDTYRSYFSMDLIEKTRTEVGSHEFTFMGRFVGDQSTTFGDGDDAQVHFLKVLEGKDEAAGFVKDIFSSDHARRLSFHEANRDRETEDKFFENARKHLKETPWVMYIGG